MQAAPTPMRTHTHTVFCGLTCVRTRTHTCSWAALSLALNGGAPQPLAPHLPGPPGPPAPCPPQSPWPPDPQVTEQPVVIACRSLLLQAPPEPVPTHWGGRPAGGCPPAARGSEPGVDRHVSRLPVEVGHVSLRR